VAKPRPKVRGKPGFVEVVVGEGVEPAPWPELQAANAPVDANSDRKARLDVSRW
jgi:hypothetical protein